MRLRAVWSFLVMLLMVAAVSGCAKKEEPKPVAPAPVPAVSAVEEGKALFEQKCGVCHGLDRATARAETKERWMEIIKQMQEKKADWIPDADAAKILEYLSSTHGK
jgi:mono/diheme cytochrome c family protein